MCDCDSDRARCTEETEMRSRNNKFKYEAIKAVFCLRGKKGKG